MEGTGNTMIEPGAEHDSEALSCSLCRREVLIGESVTPYRDERSNRHMRVCELCRAAASARGWLQEGAPIQRRRALGRRLRVEVMPSCDGLVDAPEPVVPIEPARALVARLADGAPDASGHDPSSHPLDPDAAPDPREVAERLLERISQQDGELARLRRELDPARRAEEQRLIQRQARELEQLRAAIAERDAQIARLQRARHDESSSIRMSRHALTSFNQSAEHERMARIARTLGSPTVNVHDEGPGIPRRVRITLTWEIAWYEFVVKLDLGRGCASVHATGTGGDPAAVPSERRRANAEWRDSGIIL